MTLHIPLQGMAGAYSDVEPLGRGIYHAVIRIDFDPNVGVSQQEPRQEGCQNRIAGGTGAVMRMVPVRLFYRVAICAIEVEIASNAGAMLSRSRVPASVSATLLVVRWNKRVPVRSSSRRMVWLIAEGETPVASVARRQLPPWATARKASSWWKSGPRIDELSSSE
jgi:hypothetical protein